MTGQSAHSSGMTGLVHLGFSLTDYKQHIIHTLRKAGYYSALSGVQHIATDNNISCIGYDKILTPGYPSIGFPSEHASSEAVKFLDSSPPQPFFLSVGFWATHRPYVEPGAGEDERYCLPPAPMPDNPRIRRDMASYKATAMVYDQCAGTVLEALDRNGLSEDTLVICTTDHGIEFPNMKCNLTDHGTGVMLIMRGPEGFTGGKVCDSLVSHIDIFPTICELLDIDKPDWLQGKSMMPLIRGEKEEINDAVFAESTYHVAYEPQRSVRTHRWKYIRRFGDRNKPVLTNTDDCPSKDFWVEHGWAKRPVAQEQLYDLVFDPNEACNLVTDPSTSEVLDNMRGRLEEWMNTTNDPLLKGPVPAPSGARFGDPDSISQFERNGWTVAP